MQEIFPKSRRSNGPRPLETRNDERCRSNMLHLSLKLRGARFLPAWMQVSRSQLGRRSLDRREPGQTVDPSCLICRRALWPVICLARPTCGLESPRQPLARRRHLFLGTCLAQRRMLLHSLGRHQHLRLMPPAPLPVAPWPRSTPVVCHHEALMDSRLHQRWPPRTPRVGSHNPRASNMLSPLLSSSKMRRPNSPSVNRVHSNFRPSSTQHPDKSPRRATSDPTRFQALARSCLAALVPFLEGEEDRVAVLGRRMASVIRLRV